MAKGSITAATLATIKGMNSDTAIRAFQEQIAMIAATKLGRDLSRKEAAFITTRAGFVALEAISDPVSDATNEELERYLNSE